ncbi:MAG TPA: methylmalonyl Co-A mutase-associated GTPase MeaB [Firmicutes bacterium]|nr:methylmalonyl Co-A mutase-associated GTPase MeaB [Bacillota bacterium]
MEEDGNVVSILERILAGDKLALARAISMVENEEPGAKDIMKKVHTMSGKSHIVGITGAPGVGKSTLVNGLIKAFRSEGKRVGVIAVDPTSPFSGGAILGDRLRMQSHALDPGVFIRSLATRGYLGGLSKAAGQVIKLLDVYGSEVILVETVGTGQSEVDIMRYAHTVVVVVAPGLGDEIQAIKAGILEIGHVFVVNKADRDGADKTIQELQFMLDMSREEKAWKPPIIKAVASRGDGLNEVARNVKEHLKVLQVTGRLTDHMKRAAEFEVRELLIDSLVDNVISRAKAAGEWERIIHRVAGRDLDPYAAACRLSRFLRSS